MEDVIINTRQSKSRKWLLSFTLSAAAILGSFTPARAVTFNFTYQPGITQQQIEAVELAGNIWSTYLTDNVTANIHFEMTSGALPNNTLGGATPAIKKMNYDKFKLGLQSDGTANVNLLPTSNQQGSNYYVRQLQFGYIDHSGYEIMQTQANNKALGNDLSGSASGLDGYIQLDQAANWSYDYAGGTIGNNQYDFVSVALHEIGHTLGFISGIDALSLFALPTALDMFRYSNSSAAQGAINYAMGGNQYFSVDGGQTAFSVNGREAEFATGQISFWGGDGYQASHWKYDSNNPLGIMDPMLNKEQIREVSLFDLTAMDYIGWNVNHSASLNLSNLLSQAQTQAANATIQNRSSDVAQMKQKSGIYSWGYGGWWQGEQASTDVPEPVSTIGLLGLGLLGLGSWRKHRGQKHG